MGNKTQSYESKQSVFCKDCQCSLPPNDWKFDRLAPNTFCFYDEVKYSQPITALIWEVKLNCIESKKKDVVISKGLKLYLYFRDENSMHQCPQCFQKGNMKDPSKLRDISENMQGKGYIMAKLEVTQQYK